MLDSKPEEGISCDGEKYISIGPHGALAAKINYYDITEEYSFSDKFFKFKGLGKFFCYWDSNSM